MDEMIHSYKADKNNAYVVVIICSVVIRTFIAILSSLSFPSIGGIYIYSNDFVQAKVLTIIYKPFTFL